MGAEDHPFVCQKEGILAAQGVELKGLRDLFNRLEVGMEKKLDEVLAKVRKIEKNGNHRGSGSEGRRVDRAIIITLSGAVGNLVMALVLISIFGPH